MLVVKTGIEVIRQKSKVNSATGQAAATIRAAETTGTAAFEAARRKERLELQQRLSAAQCSYF